MRRNWMIGAAVAVLAAASLLAVGIGAYNAGERHQDTVEVVATGESDGRTLVVPIDGWRDGWHGGWHGGGPGFLILPLVVVGLVLLFSARRRGGWPGPGRGHGWYVDDDRELREWHRRAHAGDEVPSPGADDGR